MRYWHSMKKFNLVSFLTIFLSVLLISARSYADYQIKGDDIRVDSSGFSGILSPDDDTVQEALDTLDGLTTTPIVEQYVLTNYDPNVDPMYFGFLKDDGSWFIQKVDGTNFTVLYASGSSGYSTAWTGRSGLTYDTYDNVFGD